MLSADLHDLSPQGGIHFAKSFATLSASAQREPHSNKLSVQHSKKQNMFFEIALSRAKINYVWLTPHGADSGALS